MPKKTKDKEFDVTIQAMVTKTHRIKAQTAEDACEIAHQTFSVVTDDTPEKYEQDTLSCLQVVK